MPMTKPSVARALLAATSAVLLGGCALLFNYGNYEESVPGTGGAGGDGTAGSGTAGGVTAGSGTAGGGTGGNGTAGSGTGGCGAGGADPGLGPVKWIKTFGSSSVASGDFGQSVAVGPAGEVYFAAQFQGDVMIGGDLLPTGSEYSLILAKLDGLGQPVWSHQLGERSPSGDKGQSFLPSLAVGPDAMPVVGGLADGLIDVGMGLTQSQGYPDAFLGKVDAAGAWQWGALFGQVDSQAGRSVAVGADDGAVMTGNFNVALDFAPPCLGLTTMTQEPNVFVAKLNDNGDCLWAKHFGGATRSLGLGVAIDPKNDVVVVGEHKGTITFDALPPLTSSVGGTGTDSFLVVLDGDNGDALLATARQGAPDAGVVVTAGNDGIFWAGNLPANPAETYSIFVEKLQPGGWTAEFQSTGTLFLTAVDADGQGHVLLTGVVSGQANLGDTMLLGDTMGDAFVLSLDAVTGAVFAVTTIGGAGVQIGNAIRHDPKGGAVVLGTFNDSLTAGCETLQVSAGSDVFVAKIGP
jgi:hypothetical protein